MADVKHARDMTGKEVAENLRKLGAPKAASRASQVPMTEWEQIANMIRKMTIAELHAFERQYGMSIVPDTKKLKEFGDMSPEEQSRFQTMHKVVVSGTMA